MYVESTYGRPGDVTSLKTPTTLTSAPSCLTFYHHLYGKHLGLLTIKIHHGNDVQQVWTSGGEHGDFWQKTQVHLSHDVWIEKSKKHLIFEVTRGNGSAGDVGLDDVKLEAGNCDLPGKLTSRVNTLGGSTVASIAAEPTAQKRHILASHGHAHKFSAFNMAAPTDR